MSLIRGSRYTKFFSVMVFEERVRAYQRFSEDWTPSLLTIYFLSAGLRALVPEGAHLFGTLNTLVQVHLGIVAAIYFQVLCSKAEKREPLFSLLVLAFLFVAFGDLIYGSLVNIAGHTDLRGTWAEMSYNLAYTGFWVLSAGAFIRLLAALPIWAWATALGFFSLYYWAISQSYFPIIRQEGLAIAFASMHILCFICKGIILVSAILSGIFNQSRAIIRLCCGYILIVGYGLLLEYLEIVGGLTVGLPAEAFWSAGLFLCWRAGADLLNYSRWDDTSLASLKGAIFGLCAVACVLANGIYFLLSQLHDAASFPAIGVILCGLAAVFIVFNILSDLGKHIVVTPLNSLLELEGKDSPVARSFSFSEFSSIKNEVHRKLTVARTHSEMANRASERANRLCHDLRSPLTAFSLLGASDASDTRMTRLLCQAAHRVRSIADGYLEERRSLLMARNAALEPVLREVIEEKEFLFPQLKNQIHLNLDPAAMKRPLAMDSANLSSILSNLIQNSIDALLGAPDDAAKCISLTTADGEDRVSVVIEDAGGGISRRALDEVKNGRSFTSKLDGNGIGLISVVDRVEAVGGEVHITNDGCSGRGIRIEMTLPVTAWRCGSSAFAQTTHTPRSS